MPSRSISTPLRAKKAELPLVSAITLDCPLPCLASLLSRMSYEALVNGIDAAPATVGDVVELYEQDRLDELPGIGTGRRGEIHRCLVAMELVKPENGAGVWRIRRELFVVVHGVGCTSRSLANPRDSL